MVLSRSSVFALAFRLLLGSLHGRAEQADTYGLVADAGSTGTRMYLFHIASGNAAVEVTNLGKGPALSSFRGRPEEAAAALQTLLTKAAAIIPQGLRSSVPVSILATAGMRLVPREEQDKIYSALRQGLLQDATMSFAFDTSRFVARTITGREEGVFALVATNYLAKHLQVSLKATTGKLMGVLDLGGSSTQIATPPNLVAGEHIVPKLGAKDTFVKSFLNLGMERMRNRTFARFVEHAEHAARAERAVENPCAFSGYAEGDEVWVGTGDSAACEAKVQAVLREERVSCLASAEEPEEECLGAFPVPVPKGPAASAKFYLIAGYLYVTDFAAWLLNARGKQHEAELSTPTIAELRNAAASTCAEAWDDIQSMGLDPAKKHRLTQPHKLPHRCFELNYIVALLSSGYGFDEEERLFNIVSNIEGREIEWTLGAFLHSIQSGSKFPEL